MMQRADEKKEERKQLKQRQWTVSKGKLKIFPFSLSSVKLIFQASILESIQAKEKGPHSLLASGNKLILSRSNAGWRP